MSLFNVSNNNEHIFGKLKITLSRLESAEEDLSGLGYGSELGLHCIFILFYLSRMISVERGIHGMIQFKRSVLNPEISLKQFRKSYKKYIGFNRHASVGS